MLRTDLGDGVRLRPFTEADAEELHAVIEANRDRLRPWMPWADQDLAGTRMYVHEVNRDPRDVQRAITLDDRIVGAIGLIQLSGVPMIGYWLSGEAVGHGIVTRALAALVEHAFTDLHLNRLELRAAVDNVRSRRVAERGGFRLARTLPHAAVIDGHSVDHVVYVREAGPSGPGAP